MRKGRINYDRSIDLLSCSKTGSVQRSEAGNVGKKEEEIEKKTMLLMMVVVVVVVSHEDISETCCL